MKIPIRPYPLQSKARLVSGFILLPGRGCRGQHQGTRPVRSKPGGM